MKKKPNVSTMIPATGTIIVLLTIITYFVLSGAGIIISPFFDHPSFEKSSKISLEELNKNAPKNTWNNKAKEIPAREIGSAIESNIRKMENISPFVSISIKDAINNKVLYDLQSKNTQPVASSMKILSAIASIQQLHPDYRFTTQTKIYKNNLYFSSNGDILLNPNRGNNSHPIGYAGLETLAENTAKQLKKNNIKQISLNIDDLNFGTETTLPEWQEQQTAKNIGQIVPFAINRGLLPNKKYTKTPQDEVVNIFAKHFKNRQIQVVTINEHKKTPENAKKLAEIKSDTLANILKFALKNSDNTLSETTTRAAAINAKQKPTFKQTSKFVIKQLQKLDINTNNIYLEDSCGLSSNNKISTDVLTSALEKTFINNYFLFDVYYGLPIGGVDGTLDDRFTSIANKVFAKTGTLSQTSSLTGVIITNSGIPLNFSINMNGFSPDKLLQARKFTDDLVTNLQKL